jgi:hypothetical protein
MRTPVISRLRGLGLTGILALVQAAGAQTAPVAALDAALADYERSHWREAYVAFCRLADDGDAEAARLALQMLRYGPQLYGERFEAIPQAVERWRATLASAAVAAR